MFYNKKDLLIASFYCCSLFVANGCGCQGCGGGTESSAVDPAPSKASFKDVVAIKNPNFKYLGATCVDKNIKHSFNVSMKLSLKPFEQKGTSNQTFAMQMPSHLLQSGEHNVGEIKGCHMMVLGGFSAEELKEEQLKTFQSKYLSKLETYSLQFVESDKFIYYCPTESLANLLSNEGNKAGPLPISGSVSVTSQDYKKLLHKAWPIRVVCFAEVSASSITEQGSDASKTEENQATSSVLYGVSDKAFELKIEPTTVGAICEKTTLQVTHQSADTNTYHFRANIGIGSADQLANIQNNVQPYFILIQNKAKMSERDFQEQLKDCIKKSSDTSQPYNHDNLVIIPAKFRESDAENIIAQLPKESAHSVDPQKYTIFGCLADKKKDVDNISYLFSKETPSDGPPLEVAFDHAKRELMVSNDPILINKQENESGEGHTTTGVTLPVFKTEARLADQPDETKEFYADTKNYIVILPKGQYWTRADVQSLYKKLKKDNKSFAAHNLPQEEGADDQGHENDEVDFTPIIALVEADLEEKQEVPLNDEFAEFIGLDPESYEYFPCAIKQDGEIKFCGAKQSLEIKEKIEPFKQVDQEEERDREERNPEHLPLKITLDATGAGLSFTQRFKDLWTTTSECKWPKATPSYNELNQKGVTSQGYLLMNKEKDKDLTKAKLDELINNFIAKTPDPNNKTSKKVENPYYFPDQYFIFEGDPQNVDEKTKKTLNESLCLAYKHNVKGKHTSLTVRYWAKHKDKDEKETITWSDPVDLGITWK